MPFKKPGGPGMDPREKKKFTSSKPLTKKELRNIIDKGWEARREKIKARAEQKNEACKRWKQEEKLVESGKLVKLKRIASYIPSAPSKDPSGLSPLESTGSTPLY